MQNQELVNTKKNTWATVLNSLKTHGAIEFIVLNMPINHHAELCKDPIIFHDFHGFPPIPARADDLHVSVKLAFIPYHIFLFNRRRKTAQARI